MTHRGVVKKCQEIEEENFDEQGCSMQNENYSNLTLTRRHSFGRGFWQSAKVVFNKAKMEARSTWQNVSSNVYGTLTRKRHKHSKFKRSFFVDF